MVNRSYLAALGLIRHILSRVTASGYIVRLTFRSLSDVSYSDESQTKKAFMYVKRMLPLFLAVVNQLLSISYLILVRPFSLSESRFYEDSSINIPQFSEHKHFTSKPFVEFCTVLSHLLLHHLAFFL